MDPSRPGWAPGAPVPTAPRPAPAHRLPVANVVLFLLTLLTTTLAGALQAGADPLGEPASLLRGLPFAVALMAILGAHEAGHYLMCVRYGVRASLPYFLPGPPYPAGTFGAFIRIRAPFPDRRALFDIGAAGPWAGFVVAIAVTIVGLGRSTILAAPPETNVVMLGDSLLTDFLTRHVIGADPSTVMLDPVAYAGWIGFLVTALNLLPVGQLDGGHVLYAVGRGRGTRIVPTVLIIALVSLGLSGWPGWLLWGGIAAALLALGHPPTLNDLRPLGTARRLAALATFVLLVLVFVAEPIRLLP
jgi:membrane-associated protease RseP (regulator of RpoE activity)